MSVVLGLTLAAGILLIAAPYLWPAGISRARAMTAFEVRVRERLTQAGLERVGPAMVGAVSAVLGLSVGFLTAALTQVASLSIAASVMAAGVPAVVITHRARIRRRATRVVWPDTIDQLVSAVRSGLALADALGALASVGPPAVRDAFSRFDSDYRSTGNFSSCVDELKERLADPVADRILETLRMSREVGGTELTTMLRNLGAHLRQEAAIRSEVEARQSWVVTAARLGVAAPWVVLLLLTTRPEAAAAYNTAAGSTLIAAGLAASVIAYRAMLALGRLPEERRWLR